MNLPGIRAIARHLNEPVIILDRTFNIVCMNKAAETLYGCPEHDLLHKPLDTLHADPLGDLVHREIHQTMLSKRIWSGAYTGRKSDGSTFVCNLSIVPHMDDNGHLSFSICMIRDITRDRYAHQALSDAEERVNLALKGADIGLWDWYVTTGRVVVDERSAEIWGYSPEQVPKTVDAFDNMIHPCDLEDVRQVRDVHLEGKTPSYEVMFRVRIASGDWVWIQNKAKTTQMDEHGNPLRVTGTCQDVTRYKLAEESMRKGEEILRATFNAIDSGILAVDNDGNVSQMNRQFGELWRIPAEILETCDNEKMIRSVLDQLEDPEKFLSVINELCNSTRETLEEIRFKDGRVYEHFSSPLIRDGRLKGRIFNFRDITERRQGEEEKKKLEAQLTRAQKMEAMGRLAGGIAHDFNNILSAVIGYAELAAFNIDNPLQARRDINEVLKAADRAKDLISHILTFSRQNEARYAPLEIRPIIKETIRMLRSVIPTTIEIRQYLKDSGLILSDPTNIHQVLMNLCTNAVYAMNKTGGVLEIGLERIRISGDAKTALPDLPCGTYVRLTVSDTGEGIPPEVMDRIFEPYFTTKELGEGTGLGLSVAHGIVKDHGGYIFCKSMPGQGATFDIYLPELESGEEQVPARDKGPLSLGTERILFVDDESMLTDLGKMMIESLGYSVETRTGSIEALELFRNDPGRFDLVITDMTMPGMTGDKLAQHLLELRGDIPVILCTGYSECITEERAKELGIREFILKPLLRKDLSKTIRKVLDGR